MSIKLKSDDWKSIPKEATDFIIHGEGFRSKWYRDTAGVLTIGYGTSVPIFKLLTGMDPVEAPEITKDEAFALMAAYIAKIAHPAVRDWVKVELNPHQYAAVISFIYNVGSAAFRRSSVIRHLNARNFNSAMASLAQYCKRKDKTTGQLVIDKGLVNRRSSEIAMFNKPYPA